MAILAEGSKAPRVIPCSPIGLDMVDVHISIMAGLTGDAYISHDGQNTVMDTRSYILLKKALMSSYWSGAVCPEYVIQNRFNILNGWYALGQVAEPPFFY